MYKVIGSDGKEYGPISLEQLQQWRAEGRINARTRVLGPGSTEWKTAAELPELGLASPPGIPGSSVSALPPSLPAGEEKGLAIASFVLGILSMVCFGFLAGIPAIICGHIARSRVRRSPAQYTGAGFALAGLIMGYFSIIVTFLILPAMLLPALARAKARAQSINCLNNMKQIGLGFKIWALDHQDQFPFNVSTNAGGTLEFCALGSDGLDRNATLHFQVLSNELNTPKILVCVSDSSKLAASDFANLRPANVSYQLYSGTNVSDTNFQQILAICPIHGHVLRCDGSVQQKPRSRR